MMLQRAERVERGAAVGTPFGRAAVPGGRRDRRATAAAATGARRRRGRLVAVAVAAHRRRFLEPRQVIVHVHFDLDVGHQRLPAYDARRGERHLAADAAVQVGRAAVLLQMLVELVLVVDRRLAVAAHGAGGHLRQATTGRRGG